MEPYIVQSPGYNLADYLLVLNPHEDLRVRIAQVQKEFKEQYTNSYASGKPHITLVKFCTWQMMETKILNRLKVVALGTRPFKVSLKDYGSFPSHTIFINVISKLPIENLSRALRVTRQLIKSPGHDPHFMSEPHLTIARQLKGEEYDKAWIEYSNRSFTGAFMADSMLLLKRKTGSLPYKIMERFDFKDLPVNTKQGNLFI